jgi:hypothetical protein
LKADEGLTDAQTCESFSCSTGMPYKTRKAFTERVLAAIHRHKPDREPDREYDCKLDGDAETRLIKPTCSDPRRIDFKSISHKPFDSV